MHKTDEEGLKDSPVVEGILSIYKHGFTQYTHKDLKYMCHVYVCEEMTV